MEASLIDWSSSESHVLLNPRLPNEDRALLDKLAEAAPRLDGHIWLATSGTTGTLRLVALSKPAMLASAEAVNVHIDTAGEAWCCVLPAFHVGGLAIYARAFLSNARVISTEWDARRFASMCDHECIGFASLVAAQVHDLVREQVPAPRAMRAVIVGGGALSSQLYESGRALGWPLLPSYGMTECCSQIATATHRSSDLVRLSHLEARTETDGRLAFRGRSLLTGHIEFDSDLKPRYRDPKVEGWFISDDIGEIDGRILRVAGRAGELVKIGGESVDLRRFDAILDGVRGDIDAVIVPVDDVRLGRVIHLVATIEDPREIVDAFNVRVLPFERIRGVHYVQSIPRSPLGKLLRSRLVEKIRC